MIAPSGALRYGGGVCCRTYIGLGESQAAGASPAAPKITKRIAVILFPAIDIGILAGTTDFPEGETCRPERSKGPMRTTNDSAAAMRSFASLRMTVGPPSSPP